MAGLLTLVPARQKHFSPEGSFRVIILGVKSRLAAQPDRREIPAYAAARQAGVDDFLCSGGIWVISWFFGVWWL